MRALKFAGAAVAAIIVVIALMLIIGIPSSFINAAIGEQVERATGYRLTVAGTTRIGLWPHLNVTANDLTLEDPKDHDGVGRVSVGRVQADLTLASAWSGHPHITALVVTKPVIHVPLLRNREAASAAKPAKPAIESPAVAIDRIRISDGAMVFSNKRDHVENRIDQIEAEATIDADRKVNVTGSARASASPFKFAIAAQAPKPPLEQQNVPVDIKIEAPDLLNAPLAAKAELRLAGSLIKFNGVSGTLGDGAFSGWASVDATSKPLVKVDLDFRRLDLPLGKAQANTASQSWSNAPFDLTGLNYVDAQVHLSAADASIGQAQLAPAEIDATLAGGVLKAALPNLGAYGGQANGELIVDATSGSPTFAMHCDLAGVSALPLLTSLADFDKIEGKLQAKIAARAAGNSEQAIMSNLSGTVFANFTDGAIRGVNVAQMIRNLTASTLSGWQESKEQTTDLTQLSASFRIDHGEATTTDLNLIGPLVTVTGVGTIDVPSKQIGFRVEPKLVLTTEGQGRTSEPVGFGIPVLIEGPWAGPRIYPDMAGILDNPDAAYAKLREMGKGLFGPNGGLGGILNGLTGGGSSSDNSGASGDSQGGLLGGKLGETLGNLIQQGLSGEQGRRSRGIPPNSSSQPQTTPAPQPPAPGDNSSQGGRQDSQPMNDVLKQLFSR